METVRHHNLDIEVFDEDKDFSAVSADNLNEYDFVYRDSSSDRIVSKHGIRVKKDGQVVQSALVCASAGATGVHENCFVIDDQQILICCCDQVFCLTLPTLQLKWMTQADQITCFQLFKISEGYIVHGELSISRLDCNGNIVWEQGGRDIFVTMDGTDFKLTADIIEATDFQNDKYVFDLDGNVIQS